MRDKEKLMRLLEDHGPFDELLQKKVGRDRAIVYVVYLLDKNGLEPTFQRICVSAFKLFPESFSFTEFSEYPDSRIARNTLWHCVDASKGWLTGSDKTKYGVTEAGKEVVNIFQKFLENARDMSSLPPSLRARGETKKELATRARDSDINFLEEIKASKAYTKFIEGKAESISPVEIRTSMGGDRYSSVHYLSHKLKKAQEACKITNESELDAYLIWIKNKWPSLFGD